jgi:hypothetical protein
VAALHQLATERAADKTRGAGYQNTGQKAPPTPEKLATGKRAGFDVLRASSGASGGGRS